MWQNDVDFYEPMTDNVKMLFDKKNIPKVNVFVKCVFIYGTIDSCDEFMTPFMVKFWEIYMITSIVSIYKE